MVEPTDVEILRSGELMVSQVEGLTESGIEFIDSHFPTCDYFVVDSGRIILSETGVAAFVKSASAAGITIATLEGT